MPPVPSAAARPVASTPVSWRLHREIVLLAGWGRAILLQLAHPLVAQGVADHSAFARDPRTGTRRLRATLGTMLALTFGSPDEVLAAAQRINGIHDHVHGTVPGGSGRFPPGTPYSAHDPALLAWVHLTLVDSFLLTYGLFVSELTAEERNRYCVEAAEIEPLLGIPQGYLPRTHADARQRFLATLESRDIEVTDTARGLARELLHPPLPVIARPLIPLARLPTVGLLPRALREAYGLAWSARRERALRALAALSRGTLPMVPGVLRYWPSARAAIRREARSAPPGRR